MNDRKSILVATIGGTAICIAAIIGILQPIVSRWVDNNFPTNTPLASIPDYAPMATEIPALVPSPIGTAQPITSQKVDSQLTGGGIEQTYSKDLNDGEIIVGHSSNVSFAKGTYQKDYWAVSFLIVGPGHFDFQVYSGRWDEWTGISQEKYKPLLQEQFSYDILLQNGISCSHTTPICIGQEGYIDCPIIDCP